MHITIGLIRDIVVIIIVIAIIIGITIVLVGVINTRVKELLMELLIPLEDITVEADKLIGPLKHIVKGINYWGWT